MSQHEVWTDEIKSDYSLFDLNLKEVWRYRDLVYLLVKRDFVTSFKQTVLGPLWFFITPVLTTIVFMVFGNIAKLSTNGAPPLLFYMAGNILWSYFSTCLNSTATVFQANASIFGKVYFPRLVMPISIVISNLMRFGVQFVLFILMILYFVLFKEEANVHPNVWMLITPYLMLLIALLTLGLGMIFSALTTKYRDFTVLIGFGIQLAMYATPILFPLSEVPGWAELYVKLNPLTSIFEIFRYAYLGKDVGVLDLGMLLYSTIFTVVTLIIGVLTFNKVQRSFMDTV